MIHKTIVPSIASPLSLLCLNSPPHCPTAGVCHCSTSRTRMAQVSPPQPTRMDPNYQQSHINTHPHTFAWTLHPCCQNSTNFAVVYTLRCPHRNCRKRDVECVLHGRTRGHNQNLQNGPLRRLNPNCRKRILSWVRDCSDTWQPLTRQSTSQHWSTSQLWARAVNVGQTGYFYTIFGRWFLCRNPKWCNKE